MPTGPGIAPWSGVICTYSAHWQPCSTRFLRSAGMQKCWQHMKLFAGMLHCSKALSNSWHAARRQRG